MKSSLKYSFILLAFIAVSSCQKTRNSLKPEFKYYNFCPDGSDLLLLVDNWSNFPNGVAYKQSGGYYGTYPYDNDGSQALKVQSKNTGMKYLETTISLKDYYKHAIFTAGSVLDIDQLTIPAYPESGSGCKIRFVNLCPDCDTVSLTINGTNYTGKVPYLSASDYVNVAADSVTAEVRKTNATIITTERKINLPGYRTVNIVLSGYKDAVNPTYFPAITVLSEN